LGGVEPLLHAATLTATAPAAASQRDDLRIFPPYTPGGDVSLGQCPSPAFSLATVLPVDDDANPRGRAGLLTGC
jgi:hypothetical protein